MASSPKSARNRTRKVKIPRNRQEGPEGVRSIDLIILYLCTRTGGKHQASTALPLGKTPYPLYGRLGGPQDRCVMMLVLVLTNQEN
jgi:hypothetical protein